MKTVLLFACAIFLLSCQKEVFLPHEVKEDPKEVVIPEPQPEPEPEPEPEPLPEPESETVYLRDLPNHFTSQNHFKLIKVYSDNADLWESTPEWVKDDVHTMNDFGDGSIESTNACPQNSFESITQNWTAYADDQGVRLTWVDLEYEPVTFIIKSINVGKSFTVYYSRDGVKTYLQFAIVAEP
jgi:hypothetical protein